SREPLPGPLEDQVLRWAQAHLADADACLLSDYAKGVVSRRLAEQFIRMARGGGKPVVVDPKGAEYVKYRGATVLTPNVSEAEKASGQDIAGEAGLLE